MCVPISKKCVVPTVFRIVMKKYRQFTKKLLKLPCETKNEYVEAPRLRGASFFCAKKKRAYLYGTPSLEYWIKHPKSPPRTSVFSGASRMPH